jgi:predicted methyltransferase
MGFNMYEYTCKCCNAKGFTIDDDFDVEELMCYSCLNEDTKFRDINEELESKIDNNPDDGSWEGR